MYTKLEKSHATFASMRKEFGVVTVRNAKIYELEDADYSKFEKRSAYEIANAVKNLEEGKSTSSSDNLPKITYRGKIDTLKTASVSTDGPTKTITGGQYNEPLLKYGKTVTVSRQDALGNHKALQALCGTVSEYSDTTKPTSPATEPADANLIGRHITPQFATAKRIIGESFFIDKATGEPVNVKIIFYKFLPDSLFNLTQEADGDASVFDRNGTLVPVKIQVGQSDGHSEPEQVFWSVINPDSTTVANPTTAPTGPTGATGATGK